jgi:hypothetical protein
VVVLQVEAVKHVDHLTRLRDGLADIVEIVKESLQLGTRNSDGHITLVEIAEFSLVEDGALELIVVEEVGDGCLDRERVHLTTTNGHSSKQGVPLQQWASFGPSLQWLLDYVTVPPVTTMSTIATGFCDVTSLPVATERLA